MGIFDKYENIQDVIDEAIKTYHPEGNRDYKTGQFIKGKSGNPKGRPKRNLKTRPNECLNKILSQFVETTINGKHKKITCLEVLIHKLVSEIIKGDDTKLLLQFLKIFRSDIDIQHELETRLKPKNEGPDVPGYIIQSQLTQLLDILNGIDRTSNIPKEYIVEDK